MLTLDRVPFISSARWKRRLTGGAIYLCRGLSTTEGSAITPMERWPRKWLCRHGPGLGRTEIITRSSSRAGKGGFSFRPITWDGRSHEARYVLPKAGDLYLTIDETIQYIVERAGPLHAGVQPKQAMIIAANRNKRLAAASKPD